MRRGTPSSRSSRPRAVARPPVGGPGEDGTVVARSIDQARRRARALNRIYPDPRISGHADRCGEGPVHATVAARGDVVDVAVADVESGRVAVRSARHTRDRTKLTESRRHRFGGEGSAHCRLMEDHPVEVLELPPTATQFEPEEHDTASRSGVPEGIEITDQLTPPSVVSITSPVDEAVLPTATQTFEVGQLTPSKCQWSLSSAR